jgi:hypothetical protein
MLDSLTGGFCAMSSRFTGNRSAMSNRRTRSCCAVP